MSRYFASRWLRAGASAIALAASLSLASHAQLRMARSATRHERDRQNKLDGVVADERVAPTRDAQLAALKQAERDGAAFDVLVIGGGATGTGIALDAATRGLRVCLVERDDYAAGTSSRSTKLIHGGVRYLETAFKELDVAQAQLVFEALQERALFLRIAPHLTQPMPIMTPTYTRFDAAYYWAGLKVYDAFARIGATKSFGVRALFPRHTAGQTGLYPSRFLSAEEAIRMFPTLARAGEHGRLKGCCLYYDGQFNDSRMAVALAMSAAAAGAVTVNHCQATALLFERRSDASSDVVAGAIVVDRLSGDAIAVRASVVINGQR